MKSFKRVKLTAGALMLGLLFLVQGCQTHSAQSSSTKAHSVGASSAHFNTSSTSLLKIEKEYVSGSMASGEFRYRLYVKALETVGNVRVEERLPEGVQFVKSNPRATQKGEKIYIPLGNMGEGEEKIVDLVYLADFEGEFSVCSIVSGDPMVCAPLIAGLPQLKITKEGPETAELGDLVEWTMIVKNVGSATATAVRFEDMLPTGFKATSPQSYDLGDLKPGQGKKITVQAEAMRVGDYTNKAKAMLESGQMAEAFAAISIMEPRVSIQKTGPDQAYVFTPAGYSIAVYNEGETTLRDLVIKDYVPDYSDVVDSGGGSVRADSITWHLDALAPGQQKTFNVRLTGNRPGVTTNTAMVMVGDKLQEEAHIDTRWIVAPGIQTSLIDSGDPIRVGETTVYTAEILNQGDFKALTVKARISFSDELSIVGIQSDAKGTVVGNSIEFKELTIEPGKSVIVKIKAKGAHSGVGVAIMEVSADFLPKVNVNQESTTIY